MMGFWKFFCRHDWELILEYENTAYRFKTYRCKKCGKEHMYRCG